ncbi:maleate cis-trans isomerase family protein [Salipiger abyssi]|uniref:maleate cis-trans isomerase family protein n=1 Tax=Salipiger abyssi TaxID=1250539 RepID=UPI00405862A5
MATETTDRAAPDLASGRVRFGARARFGIIMPSGNRVAEGELAAMMPRDISLHVTRLRLTGSSPEELDAMTRDIDGAAALVGDVAPSLVGFHCTAVSTQSAAREADILARARAASGSDVVATSEAVVAALEALSARKIVLVTPYLDHIVESEVAFLNRHGIAVADAFGQGLNTTAEMAGADPALWYDLTRQRQTPEAEAYFLSCTAIRSLETVAPLEAILGKPVITSNQVMAWHLLRRAGLSDRPEGFGCLLSQH